VIIKLDFTLRVRSAPADWRTRPTGRHG
jgi:hypothetical protein